jgi:membrane protein
MSQEIEAKIEKIPVLNLIVRGLKKVKLKTFQGLSLYDLLEMYVKGIIEGALSTRASAIAFSLFMALFPLLIFLITLIPFIIPYAEAAMEPGESFEHEFMAFIESFLPAASSDFFEDSFDQIKGQRQGGLLSSAFLMSIFLVANGVNAIFAGFENSYHVELTRNFFRQYAYSIMVGLILSIMLILGILFLLYFEFYVVYYLSELAERTGAYSQEQGDTWGAWITRFIVFFGLVYIATAVLYYFGTVEGRKIRFFSAGALMTTLLFGLTSYLFGIYVEKFARYNELYGTIGTMLILMVFIWLNANILLLGFELNAAITSLKKKVPKEELDEI